MGEPSSSSELPSNFDTELRIGSYRVLEPLAAGGMSTVFRAVHEETSHEVVLKVLTGSLAKNPVMLQRFIREADSAERLHHENIVTIYDRGIDAGRHYLVLEYVRGGDFQEYVRRFGPLDLTEAVSTIKSAALGLQYAADRGVIHRDIKPSNVLRTIGGQAKITDLGLALQTGSEDERVTRQGTTIGTVDYIAPEQARNSRAASVRSDIYSLGCTFYYLLTGSAPFSGGDVIEKLVRHAQAPPPDVRDVRPKLEASVAVLIQKMMAKIPEDRFASYDELIHALDALGAANNSDRLDISRVLQEDEVYTPSALPQADAIPNESRSASSDVRRFSSDDDGVFKSGGPASRDATVVASDENASPSPSGETRRGSHDDDGVFSDGGPASRDANVVASAESASPIPSGEARRASRDDDGVFSDGGPATRDVNVVSNDESASPIPSGEARRASRDDDGVFSDGGPATRDVNVVSNDESASPIPSGEARRASRDDDGVFSNGGQASRAAGGAVGGDDSSSVPSRKVRRGSRDDEGVFSDGGQASRAAGGAAKNHDARPTPAAARAKPARKRSDETSPLLPRLAFAGALPARAGREGSKRGPRRGQRGTGNDARLGAKRDGSRSLSPIWVIACLFAVIGMLLLGNAVMRSVSTSSRQTAKIAPQVVTEPATPKPAPADSQEAADAVNALANRAPTKPEPTTKKVEKVAVNEARTKWVEPPDSDTLPNGRVSDDDANSRAESLPEWAREAIPDRIKGPFVQIRRVAESSGDSIVASLHTALDQKAGGTVEIADEGPIFNDDFRVAGESRLIRAQPGRRAIVRVDRTGSHAVRKLPATFMMDGQDVTLERIDLVVDVRDLPAGQTALFACVASSLTLKDCSVTILNPNNIPFSLVRVEPSASRSTHLRLDRTLIRGGLTLGIDFGSSSAELAVHQCVIVGAFAPLVRLTGAVGTAEQRLFFVDNVLLGRGPLIRLTASEQSRATKPVSIRALGNVLGRLEGGQTSSVISSANLAESAAKQVAWAGNNNLFAGWKAFFSLAKNNAEGVRDLAQIRSTWNGSDSESQENLSPVTIAKDLAAVNPDDLAAFGRKSQSVLSQVARPRHGLFPKAIDKYLSPPVPQPVGWAKSSSARANTSGTQSSTPRARAGDPYWELAERMEKRRKAGNSSIPLAPPAAPTVPKLPDEVLELSFETSNQTWAGDLGAFLKERLSASVRHARVRVTGSGQHLFTPIRLPNDLWLEIRVESVAGQEPLSWSPIPRSTGPALISLDGGALVLSNVVLRDDETSRLENLIAIEGGHIVLSSCQLTAKALADGPAKSLISFRSPTTRPDLVDPVKMPFASPADRPVCLIQESVLITGGTALKAELGRGLIALTQSATAAGVACVELVPAKVSRQRFDADLIMDHCTLTSERSIIEMGPWPGLTPGPDRPWLITSRNCAFLSMSGRGTRETILLRSEAAALASGAISWQASDDAVDVDISIASGNGNPAPNRSHDVRLQWIDLWGHNHMNGQITGRRGAVGPPSVQFVEKLHPGRIEPGDLALNREHHPGRRTMNVGADLNWLGFAPRRRAR